MTCGVGLGRHRSLSYFNEVEMAAALDCRMDRSILWMLSAFAVLIPGEVHARQVVGEQSAPSVSQRDAPDAGVPRITAVRRTGPIQIDGLLDDPAWADAPVGSGFVQVQPVEGNPAVDDTEIRILYDDDAIYVAARMLDQDPTRIADQLTRRDEMGQYDMISIAFDPNRDRRTAYQFQVSAAGVQLDGYFHSDRNVDRAWDAVWESAVARDSLGWTAEFRIPLSQIRYEPSDSIRSWGFNARRVRVASGEETFFSLISRLQQGLVSQFGLVDGMQIPRAARRAEVRPYLLSQAHFGPAEDGNPFFDGREASYRMGADFRVGLGGMFTLDGTVNPDFGQVEADPAVINLTAFETFLEERRPFFVEGAGLFDFSLSGGQNRLFHSRRVGRRPVGSAPTGAAFSDVPQHTAILGAAKLSGRTEGGLSIGVVAAVTREEEGAAYFADADESHDFLAEPRAGFGVLRLQQDFHDGASTVGAIVTGMRRFLPEDGSYDHLTQEAYSAGVDFSFQWDERRWGLQGFFAGSHVRGDSTSILRVQRSSGHYFQRPDALYVSVDPSAMSMTGAEWRLQLDRQQGNWTGAVWTAQVTPGFEVNDAGFSQVLQRLDGGARIGYRQVRASDRLRNWNVTASTFHNLSHDLLEAGIGSWSNWRDAQMSGNFRTQGNVEFLNFWRADLAIGYSPETQNRTATRGGPRMTEPASIDLSTGFRTDPRARLTFAPNVSYRRGRLGDNGRIQARLVVEYRPSSQLDLRLRPEFSRDRDDAQFVAASSAVPYAPTFGPRYLFGKLQRTELSMEARVNWTFSPTLTLQLYAQPFISAGRFLEYRQLAQPGMYDFLAFTEGYVEKEGGVVRCIDGSTCVDQDRRRYMDFDGNGVADYALDDRDFNVRSLIGNAVLRWEFRPGSRIYFVWQRQQRDRSFDGTFDFGRDTSALFRAPADNVFLIKVDYWLDL